MTIKPKQYLWLDIDWEDSWFSSHYLIKNLRRCYHEKLGPAFHSLRLPLDTDVLTNFIQTKQITSVIIADPRINLQPILKILNQVGDGAMEYLIHVIGAPLRKLEDLKKMKIDEYKVCLMAGSMANYEILKNFSHGEIKYFPFVPDSAELRDPKISFIENKFIYFGRLSFQKNLVALLELFSRFQREVNPKAELSIYGSACNSNFPVKPHGHYIGMSAERFFLK